MTERRKLIELLFPFVWGGGIGILAVFFGRGTLFHRLSDGFSIAGVLLLAKWYFSIVKRKGFLKGLRYVGERIKERLLPFVKMEEGREEKENVDNFSLRRRGELVSGMVYLAVGGGFLFFL